MDVPIGRTNSFYTHTQEALAYMSEKTRKFQEFFGGWTYTKDGKTWTTAPPTRRDMGTQKTVSIGHPINRKTGNREGGGPFYSALARRSFPTQAVELIGPPKSSTEKHHLRCKLGTPIENSILPSSVKEMYGNPTSLRSEDLSDLDPKGATAISLVAPTNPNANAATMLGEIAKDGIVSLPGIRTWRSRTDFLRSLGDEYLNVEFGWKPLVHDVRGVSSSIAKRHSILSQYERDSGRNVRREFAFPVERKTTTITPGNIRPSVSPNGQAEFPVLNGAIGGSPMTLTLVEESRMWFSGCFTYTTPPPTDSRRKMAYASDQANYLLGTSLSPEVLWELTPWSWAVDWFSNTGNVITNFTNFALQGLVMRYGYIMNEKIMTMTASLSGGERTPPVQINKAPPQTYTVRVKSRAEANPFGFGIGWQDLSPTQLAITAALGITRVRL
jgi:hypothetical protein